MADDPAPAPAEAQEPLTHDGEPLTTAAGDVLTVTKPVEAAPAADPAKTADGPSKAAAPAQATSGAPGGGKVERIAALIRNGLSNTAVSQSAEAWSALETRLPQIVAAIIQEA